MFASEFGRLERKSAADRIGVRFSAVLLTLLAIPFGVWCLLLAWLLCRGVSARWSHHVSQLGNMVGFNAVSFLVCAVITVSSALGGNVLMKGKRWGAWIAIGFGALFLCLSAMIVYGWYHPHKEAPDEYFDILYMPMMALTGLWWCIYLNWPSVRASFQRVDVREESQSSLGG